MNPASSIFIGFVVLTLAITWWSSGRSRTAVQFYTADASITPLENGIALAGDYLSAASFLGTTAAFFSFGIDGIYYAVGALAGWPVATCLVAEPLRKLGRITYADALSAKLQGPQLRVMTSAATLSICGAYLTSQMVGAGYLVQSLFHIPYTYALLLIGGLMITYVMFGGMLATTWIQIVKASLLTVTTALMTILVLRHFQFSPEELVTAAAGTRSNPSDFLRTGGLISGPTDAVGLALAFSFGPAGMPHVLMRFFTVKDPQSARRSLVYATSVVALFQLMIVVLGLGTIALVSSGPHGSFAIGDANLAAVRLAQGLGGDVLFGIVAAVCFATILAVVAGLTLASTTAVSHDLYRYVIRRNCSTEREEIAVSKVATLAIGALAVGLGLICRNQNVGFLATLPLVIAASSNFPILVLAIYWPRLTTAGALAGGYVGLATSILSVILGPKVWTQILGRATPVLSFDYATPFSLSAALAVAVLISFLSHTGPWRSRLAQNR
jgi:cation/acetate symporter